MAGMNLVFHVAAALALLALGLALIGLEKQRDMLRRLLTGGGGKLTVAAPGEFVANAAKALGIGVEGTSHLPPAKIEVGPWTELFSRARPTLLRWRGSPPAHTLHIYLATGADVPPELLRKLAQSLGGGALNVQIGD